MRIVIAAPEAVPYVKTGGLADVAGALVKEFRKMGEDAILILPCYRAVRSSVAHLKDTGIRLQIPVGGRDVYGSLLWDGAHVFFVDCPEFFDRPELYGTPTGDYGDNAARFTFFSRAILESCRRIGFSPDIIHCHDWQTGLVPLYLKTIYGGDPFFSATATLLTIHNLGYQGVFPASDFPNINLGWELFTPEGIEFYGNVNFLKAGLITADLLNTVSETYAKEILRPEFGFGLDGVLRKRAEDLYGILNGIDEEEWNPRTDSLLPSRYSADDLAGKAVCKKALFTRFAGMDDEASIERTPIIGMVTRLSEQKGLDLVLQALPGLAPFDVKLVILGKGDERFHRALGEAATRYRNAVSVTIGFDEALAHGIYAGADFFLMPSRYEPCGLGQMIALRYGAIPVARNTGGLTDTIEDFHPLARTGTGFLFSDYTAASLLDALKRAFCVYADPGMLTAMVRRAMAQDFSWKRSARRYLDVYRLARNKKTR